MKVSAELMTLIERELWEASRTTLDNASEVREYVARAIEELAKLVGQPGYDLAEQATRDNIAAKIAIAVVKQADDVDARILGIIHGALRIGVRLGG